MLGSLVKNTLVGAEKREVLSGLIHNTTAGNRVGQYEEILKKTSPAPKVNDNTMASGKAPATRVTKTHFGSVQYPGAHS
jgi:hypothetical protein